MHHPVPPIRMIDDSSTKEHSVPKMLGANDVHENPTDDLAFLETLKTSNITEVSTTHLERFYALMDEVQIQKPSVETHQPFGEVMYVQGMAPIVKSALEIRRAANQAA